MKGELISTALYAEGRPRGVGTDRAIANSLNQYVDRKSAHQSPWLLSGSIPAVNAGLVHIRPIFFGTEHVSATVDRFVTLAPWLRSSDGGLATVIATITDTMPTYAPGQDFANDFWKPSFSGKYAQATWTTTSTTWATGADATLSLSVKELNYGFALLVIEAGFVDQSAQYRGLAKCIEGVRVVG